MLQGRPLNMIVHLNVPDAVIMARIAGMSPSKITPRRLRCIRPSRLVANYVWLTYALARWVHLPSGRVYNSTYSAPKVEGLDDVTGEPLSKRPDDTPVRWVVPYNWHKADEKQETFSKRLQAYYESTAPLLQVRSPSPLIPQTSLPLRF